MLEKLLGVNAGTIFVREDDVISTCTNVDDVLVGNGGGFGGIPLGSCLPQSRVIICLRNPTREC